MHCGTWSPRPCQDVINQQYEEVGTEGRALMYPYSDADTFDVYILVLYYPNIAENNAMESQVVYSMSLGDCSYAFSISTNLK